MPSRLLVVDFQRPLSSIPGSEQFLSSLRLSGVSVVPRHELNLQTALDDGCEFIGFAGDSLSDPITASRIAKSGGVIFSLGGGAFASWCNSNHDYALERSMWMQLTDLGDAMKLSAFQQRIGGH